jgi:hypothetical protein
MGIRFMCSAKNVENHDYVLNSSINKPHHDSIRFHPKVYINVFGHLFNLYIFYMWKNLIFFLMLLHLILFIITLVK